MRIAPCKKMLTTKTITIAQFQMTMETGEVDPITRSMCFRTLKSEAGCTVFQYSIVPVTEDVAPGSEPSDEYLEITYGTGY